MTTIRPVLFAAAAGLTLAASACTFDPDAGGPDLHTQLKKRAFLDIATTSDVDVSAIARGGRMLAVDPTVLGGQVVLRTTEDGWLLVEDLDIPLQDVTVPAGTLSPDHAVTFTDLSLRLGTQLAIRTDAAEGDMAVAGWGRADLLLDWAMLSWQGAHLPLAKRRIEDAPFAVSVSLDADGRLKAMIAARVDGVVDDLGELVVLHDLAVDVQSATAIELPPH